MYELYTSTFERGAVAHRRLTFSMKLDVVEKAGHHTEMYVTGGASRFGLASHVVRDPRAPHTTTTFTTPLKLI